MARFVRSSTAQAEVDAIVTPHVRAFAEDVRRRAVAKLAEANISETVGASIDVDYGPSGLSVMVGANNRRNSDGSMTKRDIGMMIHEGHDEITPRRKPYLAFRPRGSSRYVHTLRVRAVGGVPFMAEALVEANNGLPADQRFLVVITSTPVVADKPHTRSY